MKTFLYRLVFHGPVHLGQSGIGLEETSEQLPSDSFVSAMINAAAVAESAQQFLDACVGAPPAVHFSSLFPYGPEPGNIARIAYVLPRPLSTPPLEDASSLGELGKDVKRLRYLRAEDAVRWVAGPPMDAPQLEDLLRCNLSVAMAWIPQDKSGWWAEELRPRVALDRTSQNSSIWFCASLRFAPGAGLYGLVRVDDERRLKNLENTLRLLGEMGIGGERTYGMGTFGFSGFEAIEEAWPWSREISMKRCLLLSRYYPSSSELARLDAVMEAWDFVETRGYVVTGRYATTLKRKRVRMIREGSVSAEGLTGEIADVTPDAGAAFGLSHRVYRCGLGFWIGAGGVR